MSAQLVIAARVRATKVIKPALARLKKGRQASCPHGTTVPIRYDARMYTFRLHAGVVSLSTVAGRQLVALVHNPHADRLLTHATGFDRVDLTYRKGRFRRYLVVTRLDPAFAPTGEVVGVDRELNHPAVLSTAQFLGEKRWKAIDRWPFRLMRAKGTRSAERYLKHGPGKVHRFRRDCDHVLSRRLVDSVEPDIVMGVENLARIRQRTKQRGRESRRMHSWTFAQLRSFLEQNARAFPFVGRRPGGGQVPRGFPSVTGGGLLAALRGFSCVPCDAT
jgi:IS605 OrfB family transposase